MFSADSTANEFLRTAERRALEKGPIKTFLGTAGKDLIQEVAAALPLFRRLPTDNFELLVAAAEQVLRSGDWRNATALLQQHRLAQSRTLNLCMVATFFILREALRKTVPGKKVLKDMEALDLPEEFRRAMVSKIAEMREMPLDLAPRRSLGSARMKRVSWRVDLTLTSAKVKSALQPTVSMRIELGDRRVLSFEMSIERFYQLRYAVARSLAAMHELQRHPMSTSCLIIDLF